MKYSVKKLMMICASAMLMMNGCQMKDTASEAAVSTQGTAEAAVLTQGTAEAAASMQKMTDAPSERAEAETKNREQSHGAVADAAETVAAIEVVQEGMEPVYASELKDGTYAVQVDSSSSMFQITDCELTVADGTMQAVMAMSGTGYRYLYMGTGEEAAKADEASYIPYVENASGQYTFTVPVEALDEGIACAAFSKKKEKWYDRTLVFRADSLPMDAYDAGAFCTAETLGLTDGTYLMDVELEGGSGRAKVESPAKLKIIDGECTAAIVWGSSNYDYMKMGEVRYDPVNTEGNSAFEIPVAAFDHRISVIADTTAMGTPHEISYTLNFVSESVKKEE